MTSPSNELTLDLKNLPEWQLSDGKLSRSFRFKTFLDAMDFFQHVAEYCEQVNHHPKWENCYCDVTAWLWTHDKNTVTTKDIELAKKMDQVARKLL